MNKSDLLTIRLPDKYQDCSAWFEEGMDNLPSLLGFLRSGRDKKEYEKFQQLYTIEQMKRYCAEAGTGKEDLNTAKNLIKEAIEKYNTI